MKNRISGMLMGSRVSYDKLRLRMGYFDRLMSSNEEVSGGTFHGRAAVNESTDKMNRPELPAARSAEIVRFRREQPSSMATSNSRC
jgi:hypothetical protein